MSVTYKGVLNGGADVDALGNMTAKRTLVYHFNGGESPVTILKQSQIPKRGTVHPDNETLQLTTINVSEPRQGDEAKSGRYDVNLTYARTKENIENKGNENAAPWTLPPYDVSYAPVEYVVAFSKGYLDGDTNGNPTEDIENSAGDPFEESTTQQNLILRFTYNLQDFTPSWIVDYMDTVNEEDVTVLDISIPKYKGRIRSLAVSKQRQYTSAGALQYNYWVINAEIEVSKSNWQKEILQRGLYFISGTDKERIYKRTNGAEGANYGTKTATGAGSIPCDEPQRLAANGSLLDPTGTAAVDSVYDIFYDKFYTSWSPLNLPKTFQRSSSLQILSGGTGI